jgi:hypothetical protein
MDFLTLFEKVISQHHDHNMRVRRYENDGYEIVSFSHYSEFVVVIKNVDDDLEKHFNDMLEMLQTLKPPIPIRCEVHFKKRRKSVPEELLLHRWGDYATFKI